jgi:DNA-directed RNA polymerase
MDVLSRLIKDLEYRQSKLRADRDRYTMYLRGVKPSFLISTTYVHVLKGLERNAPMVEVVCTIGRRIRQKLKLPPDYLAEVHTGWFCLISFFECKILKFYKKKGKKKTRSKEHPSFYFSVKDPVAIRELWDLVPEDDVDIFPTPRPLSGWDDVIHSETGTRFVKKVSDETLSLLKENDNSFVFRVLNKLGSVGWRINLSVYSVYIKLLNNNSIKNNPLDFSYETDSIKRGSLELEATAIERVAFKNLNREFFHLYNCDFRGRYYPNTAFLHEQSSDRAKGLLKLSEGKELGKEGFTRLLHYTSNCYGKDDLPLNDRASFVKTSLSTFLSYAENPMENTGWMLADKPFTFLACCNELLELERWKAQGYKPENFKSSLVCFIDGSCNGLQHLTAMSRDAVVAPLVNLVPSSAKGDVYSYVADFTWTEIEAKIKELPSKILEEFDELYEKSKKLQADYDAAEPGSENKRLLYDELSQWRNHTRKLREASAWVYWSRIQDSKLRRKIVKRNTMTLPYGGTRYGFGQQIIEDTRSLSDYLRDKEFLWAAMLGNLVYDTCMKRLPGPAAMLTMFEKLAERQNNNELFLTYNVPVTNFKVIQRYHKLVTKRVILKYGKEKLWASLQIYDDKTLNKNKQLSSTAPNVTHSFDAAHLSMVVDAASFKIVVVHDSFGCRAGDMEELFSLVRVKFAEFYLKDPLRQVMKQLNSEDLLPLPGKLSLTDILKSEFAFS